MSNTDWKTIPGFSEYTMDRSGNIRNVKHGNLLKVNKHGVQNVKLYNGDTQYNRSVRALLRKTWGVI